MLNALNHYKKNYQLVSSPNPFKHPMDISLEIPQPLPPLTLFFSMLKEDNQFKYENIYQVAYLLKKRDYILT